MSRSAWTIVLLLALAAAATGLWLWRGEGDAPSITGPESLVVGREPQTVALVLADPGSGLRSVRVTLDHAGGEAELLSQQFPGSALRGGGPATERVEVPIDPKKLGLPEGSAFLRVEVRDWSWRGALSGNVAERKIPLDVDLTPPRVSVETGLTYVRQGGAAVVAYRLSERPARDGVEVGPAFFPGVSWPRAGASCPTLKGGESGCRVAVFAVPVGAPEGAALRVLAEDAAGNRSEVGWATRVQPREVPIVPIVLSEGFLQNKVVELARHLDVHASDPLAAFQDINTRVRALDEARIRELASHSTPAQLWKGAFEQLPNSKVMSVFAEHRVYHWQGKVVSRATHYGYDLASTAHAPVPASNAGRVLFTGDLGIYGNAVLIDHGLGVVSLYGHLSRIDVKQGDSVTRGAVLGRSGETGLAGGDHLHFAILVDGTYVDPREWWDPKWVREHIEARLAP